MNQKSTFRIWFQLVEESGKPYGSKTAVELSPTNDICDFAAAAREQFSDGRLKNIPAASLNVYANQSAFEADPELKNPLDRSLPVGELGRTCAEALWVVAPPLNERSHMRSSHAPTKLQFDRFPLVEKLLDRVQRQTFTLISSPAGSGKTALLQSFILEMKQQCHITYISCLSDDAFEDLLSIAGIDAARQRYSTPPALLNKELPHIIILDDAQNKFHDSGTWNFLIKAMGRDLACNNCRVIISTDYSGESSPYAFRNIKLYYMSRDDMLMSSADSIKFLENRAFGLQNKFQDFNILKRVIANECGGLIGALSVCCHAINLNFEHQSTPQEEEVLNFYFSKIVTKTMARWFGSNHSRSNSAKFNEFLTKCLVEFQPNVYVQFLEREDRNTSDRLLDSGILAISKPTGTVDFSSRLAQRYYFDTLYPSRSSKQPESLPDLVEQAICKLPLNVIQQSVQVGHFPIDATVQYLFMNALAECTASNVVIHPQLARAFDIRDNITEELEFYIDGKVSWGLELLVNERQITENVDRFGPGGDYEPLKVDDYAIVNFQKSPDGNPNNIKRSVKAITILFQADDFTKCWFISGMQETRQILLATN